MPSEIRVHPMRPIADGIHFDDLEGLSIERRNLIAARDVVYLTEFKAGAKTYGGSIIASTREKAEDIAFGRGLDEKIVGVLVETIPVPEGFDDGVDDEW